MLTRVDGDRELVVDLGGRFECVVRHDSGPIAVLNTDRSALPLGRHERVQSVSDAREVPAVGLVGEDQVFRVDPVG